MGGCGSEREGACSEVLEPAFPIFLTHDLKSDLWSPLVNLSPKAILRRRGFVSLCILGNKIVQIKIYTTG